MIHIVGDIHQPLHSCALFNEKYPTGDMGGNLFTVKLASKSTIKNIHAVWDSILNKVPDGIKLPLNNNDEAIVDNLAKSISEKYTREDMEKEIDNDFHFQDWLFESWTLCRDFVYKNIKENEEISQDYIDKGYEIAIKRIAMAGYRMSNIMRESYDKYIEALRSFGEDTKYFLKTEQQ